MKMCTGGQLCVISMHTNGHNTKIHKYIKMYARKSKIQLPGSIGPTPWPKLT
jgi:hypothetical protein